MLGWFLLNRLLNFNGLWSWQLIEILWKNVDGLGLTWRARFSFSPPILNEAQISQFRCLNRHSQQVRARQTSSLSLIASAGPAIEFEGLGVPHTEDLYGFWALSFFEGFDLIVAESFRIVLDEDFEDSGVQALPNDFDAWVVEHIFNGISVNHDLVKGMVKKFSIYNHQSSTDILNSRNILHLFGQNLIELSIQVVCVENSKECCG